MKRYGSSFWILVLLMAVTGLLGGVGSLLLGLLLSPDLNPQMGLAKIGFDVAGLLALGFSLMLLVTGWRGWKNRPLLDIYLPRGWIVPPILWGGLIALIFLLPGLQQRPALIATIHLALIVLPAFFLFVLTTLAAGQFRPLYLREAVIATTGGALSTFLAFLLEMIGLLLSILLVILVASVVPGGRAEIEHLFTEFQQLSQMPSTFIPEDRMLEMVASPIVLGVLGLTLAVATPLIEELGKTVIVVIFGYRERFSLRKAYLWGVACGFGFALVEGALNGLMSIEGPPIGWAAGVGMRVPATTMHAFTSGLTGLGWGYIWQKRRRWMLPLMYLIAIFFHGLWNFSTIGMVAGSLQFAGSAKVSLGALTALLGGSLLFVLALVAPAGLIGVALWLRHRARQDDERISPETGEAVDTESGM